MTVLDAPHDRTVAPAPRRFNGIRSRLFRSVDTVPTRLTMALILGLSGMFLAYVSLWAWFNDLNQWGTFGMRFGFFVLLAVPLSIAALTMSTSYRLRMWRELGMIRMVMTNVVSVAALALATFSAYVMYSALP
jgi:hypothetical protein